MTGRPRLALTSLALAAALGLAGCGASNEEGPSSLGETSPREPAVTVDDHSVTVGDVQTATRAANEFIQKQGGQSSLATTDVLGTLMVAPRIIEAAQGSEVTVPSQETVRQALSQLEIESTPGAVEFIRAQSVREQMTPEQLNEVTQSLKDADISVNPRYGSFDPQQGFQQGSAEWLAPVEETAP